MKTHPRQSVEGGQNSRGHSGHVAQAHRALRHHPRIEHPVTSSRGCFFRVRRPSMNDLDDSLFDAALEALSKRNDLGRVPTHKRPLILGHVAECARPFLTAALTYHWRGKAENFWAVCATERIQERLARRTLHLAARCPRLPASGNLGNRGSPAGPGSLRRAARRAPTPGVKVVRQSSSSSRNRPSTRASPRRRHWGRPRWYSSRGERTDREGIVRALAEAGYENVPQVAERGAVLRAWRDHGRLFVATGAARPSGVVRRRNRVDPGIRCRPADVGQVAGAMRPAAAQCRKRKRSSCGLTSARKTC